MEWFADNLTMAVLWSAIGSLLRIVLIYILARVVIKVVNPLVKRTLSHARENISERRTKTLESLLLSVIRYVVGFAAVLAVLGELGVDTTSVLAGAGIVGLAIGFGAQNLVRDVITGFFFVFEDQFAVGDYVTAGGEGGIIEEMGLRVTKIRDFSGTLHVIPNGTVGKTTNHSRGNMRAMVDVSVAYEEDIERVLEVLERVSQELAETNEDIKEGPTVLGLAKLGDSDMVFRVLSRVEPMTQWGVEREMLKAIKQAFDREGIEIPYPRRVQVPIAATKIRGDSEA